MRHRVVSATPDDFSIKYSVQHGYAQTTSGLPDFKIFNIVWYMECMADIGLSMYRQEVQYAIKVEAAVLQPYTQ